MMQEKRRHRRLRSDPMEVRGKMISTHQIKIIDISFGGAALKADRRLNIGREYLLKLEEKGIALYVKALVVRSQLVEIEFRDNGESASIYAVGVMFRDIATQKIITFIDSIGREAKEAVSVQPGRLQHHREASVATL